MSLTVVVTGANRGIGLELCRQYAQAGAKVFAVCRSDTAELDALNVNIIDGIDVTDAGAVERLRNRLQNESIDILINNAGVFLSETLEDMDFDAIEIQLQVNAMGPLRVTQALIDQLGKNSKVALITSRMGSIADNTSGGYYGYRMSKAALNAAGVSLAHDLKPEGIAVGIFHPGFVQTRIKELNIKNSGTFWHSDGNILPW
jgi:NAD(P)-dependent dehydrogenase (short-subunit alcohol dehydrogenase family)